MQSKAKYKLNNNNNNDNKVNMGLGPLVEPVMRTLKGGTMGSLLSKDSAPIRLRIGLGRAKFAPEGKTEPRRRRPVPGPAGLAVGPDRAVWAGARPRRTEVGTEMAGKDREAIGEEPRSVRAIWITG